MKAFTSERHNTIASVGLVDVTQASIVSVLGTRDAPMWLAAAPDGSAAARICGHCDISGTDNSFAMTAGDVNKLLWVRMKSSLCRVIGCVSVTSGCTLSD